MMILVLLLVLSLEAKQPLHARVLLVAVLLDFVMLALGWAGEEAVISRFQGLVLSFLAFGLLFTYISRAFGLPTLASKVAFTAYATLWAFYGVAYLLDEQQKNIFYNVLDLIAKCFVGIFFWLYFTKIVVF
jgi:hypothetical protein